MRYFYIILFCSLIYNAILAQNISLADAQAKAIALKRGNNPPTVSSPKGHALKSISLASIKQEGHNTYYYAFNYPDGGFAIIGGNEVAKEVLGYSESGSFDEAKLPDGLKYMLLSYQEQISSAIAQGNASIVSSLPSGRKSIAPLMKTKWDQDEPYNNAIPSLGKYYEPFVTGCGATAIAQIMKYYEYPKLGKGSYSYIIDYGVDEITFGADFGSTQYDWANMLDTYTPGAYNTAEANAVATLMYHVGVAMDMVYDDAESGGSASFTSAGAKALTTYFDYDKGATMERREYYTDDQWETLVYNDLLAGHPVFYSGQSPEGGHAFVCHGYDAETDRFYFNWGWGGYCDGYFPLTGVKAGTSALSPDGTGIGGNAEGAAYTDEQSVFIGLVPNKGTRDYTPQFGIRGNLVFPNGENSYTIDRGTSGDKKLIMSSSNDDLIYLGYMDIDYENFRLYPGVILEDIATGRKYEAASETVSPSFSSSLAPCTGTYRVYPAFRYTNSGAFSKLQTSGQYDIPTLTITNGFGDANGDGHVSVADLPKTLTSGDQTQITKLINLLLQKK